MSLGTSYINRLHLSVSYNEIIPIHRTGYRACSWFRQVRYCNRLYRLDRKNLQRIFAQVSVIYSTMGKLIILGFRIVFVPAD